MGYTLPIAGDCKKVLVKYMHDHAFTANSFSRARKLPVFAGVSSCSESPCSAMHCFAQNN